MIVVVAGQNRKAGKTQAVCDIVAASPEARWVAVKITPHAHADVPSHNTDTDRFIAAGAAEAHLIIGIPPVPLPEATNLIIESNAVLSQIHPDLLIFVADSTKATAKPSARGIAEKAHFAVDRNITAEVIVAVRAALSESPR